MGSFVRRSTLGNALPNGSDIAVIAQIALTKPIYLEPLFMCIINLLVLTAKKVIYIGHIIRDGDES
jgi:hypothetical protein